jgi:hypothetical protein
MIGIVVAVITCMSMAGAGQDQFETARNNLLQVHKEWEKGARLTGRWGNAPDRFAAARIAVVPSKEMDAAELGRITEDTSIMARLLEDVIEGQTPPEGPGLAMFPILNGIRSIEGYYLAGYGAVFTVHTAFPLAPPPAPAPAAREPESQWEKAKRELYAPEPPGGISLRTGPFSFEGFSAEKYDAKKVVAARNGILNALKEGIHIRALTKDESIVVIVIGAEGGGAMTITSGPGEAITTYEGRVLQAKTITLSSGAAAAVSGTMWIFRAKKPDLDAFAEGKLSFADFAARVSVSVAVPEKPAAEETKKNEPDGPLPEP